MSNKTLPNVTMRVKVGDSEIEITGPSDFVERKIAEFVEKQRQLPSSAVGMSKPGAEGVVPSSATGSKALSVAQFFKKVSPKSDVDRGLAAGYYLERFRSAQSFTSTEIAEMIRSAKITPPKNTSDVIAKNIKKGTMMPSGDKEGRMAFVLTTDGEEAIEVALNA